MRVKSLIYWVNLLIDYKGFIGERTYKSNFRNYFGLENFYIGTFNQFYLINVYETVYAFRNFYNFLFNFLRGNYQLRTVFVWKDFSLDYKLKILCKSISAYWVTGEDWIKGSFSNYSQVLRTRDINNYWDFSNNLVLPLNLGLLQQSFFFFFNLNRQSGIFKEVLFMKQKPFLIGISGTVLPPEILRNLDFLIPGTERSLRARFLYIDLLFSWFFDILQHRAITIKNSTLKFKMNFY